MKPQVHRIAPALERWCAQDAEGEQRTVVVRTGRSIPAAAAQQAIEAAGAVIESAGAGVSTARVTCSALKALARRPEVVAIEEPRTFSPKF